MNQLCALLLALVVTSPESWDAYGFVVDETEISAALVAGICDHLVQAGDLREGQAVVVPRQTRALIQLHAYRRKKSAEALSPRESDALTRIETIMNDEAPELPIGLPSADSGCRFTPTESPGPAPSSDQTVLELSAPLLAPSYRTERAELGLFVRISPGRRDPSWYWVRLRMPGLRLAVDSVLPLDASER